MATGPATPAGLDPVAVATASEMDAVERRHSRHAAAGAAAAVGSAGVTEVAARAADASPDARHAADAVPESVQESTDASRGDPAEDE